MKSIFIYFGYSFFVVVYFLAYFPFGILFIVCFTINVADEFVYRTELVLAWAKCKLGHLSIMPKCLCWLHSVGLFSLWTTCWSRSEVPRTTYMQTARRRTCPTVCVDMLTRLSFCSGPPNKQFLSARSDHSEMKVSLTPVTEEGKFLFDEWSHRIMCRYLQTHREQIELTFFSDFSKLKLWDHLKKRHWPDNYTVCCI